MTTPDYSDEVAPLDESAIKRLGILCAEMAQAVLDQEELEEKLEQAKARVNKYRLSLVPGLMSEIGLTEITTKGGLKVELKEEVRASFPKDEEKRERAIQYLKQTGNDGLLKNEFVVSFGRGGDADAQQFRNLIDAFFEDALNHGSYTNNLTVHPQSLQKFIRDSLAAGEEIPMDAFNAFVQTIAKMKRG